VEAGTARTVAAFVAGIDVHSRAVSRLNCRRRHGWRPSRNRDLPPESPDACIWSFECTFCASCAAEKLHGICPNCSGELVVRPIRPAAKLANNPPAIRRVWKRKLHRPGQAITESITYRDIEKINFLALKN
jgi:hypothetical protein